MKSRSQIYTVQDYRPIIAGLNRAQPSIKETTMYTALRYLSLVLLIAFGALAANTSALAADSEEGILVGRIAHIEGKLLRYVEEGKDWVATVDDAPFGLEDALYSGEDTKAEFIMPNRTWLRVGENTQIQLIALNPDATTVDVASGLARLYNKSDDAVIKVTTPFGYVVAPGGTIFDLYVGDDSLEVIAVRGDVDFVHSATGSRYEVQEGSPSIIADRKTTAEGNGTVDSAWDDWNGQRDNIWAQRQQNRGSSVEYLPEPIRDEAYALEENGRWERVYYEGDYRNMWRPTRVDPGWRPYTSGRWSVYYGDNCWIPDEPFGYVTHHYGSWVYVESFRTWYWVPPVTRAVARVPGISISFGWYPGRVGWIHSGPSIGWVPLAPDEIYYGYRPWGHRTVVVHRGTVININLSRYRYLDGAVIIPRDHMYRGNRYTPYVQPNIGRAAIINNYSPSTVINNTVINNFDTDRSRFTLSDAQVARKPHATVMNRINDNQKMSRDAGRINRARIEQDLTRVKVAAQPPPTTTLRAPTLATKLVDADKINKPISSLSLPKQEIKPKNRERQLGSDNDQRRSPRVQGEAGQIQNTANQDDNRRMRSARDARNQIMEPTRTETPPQKEDPKQLGTRDRVELDQTKDAASQEENRRIRSPREIQTQATEQRAIETPSRLDDNRRTPRDRNELDQTKDAASQEENRRIRSPRETQTQETEQKAIDTPSRLDDNRRTPRDRNELDQTKDAASQEENRRIRSPRETQTQETEQKAIDTPSRLEDNRRTPRDRGEIDQTKDAASQEENRRIRSPRETQTQTTEQKAIETPTRIEDNRRAPRDRSELDQTKDTASQEENRRIRSPRDPRNQEAEQATHQQDQTRRIEESQRQQTQEMQRRQQEDSQRQQALEAQRRQQEDGQRQQAQEVQRRQQEESQRQQVQEVQRRQQEESQRQQAQEVQRRQQEESQRQQAQEAQRRQQEESQRQQAQEAQRRQQEESQRQQAQEAQRRQQEESQRQQQLQRQQQQQQQQQQPPNKRKRTPQEEELLLQGQPVPNQ
ncbi:DUF6600 domain-containing protein [uncultured Desulfobulbus sp.]|uniref:DUF6600 domain-containing protein n=1 Tax=uncultured Desulfobulbus sp. TaxID=239745 RepID=UPI0029C94E59|nr:DUF6600 domain-containing protein [uncultured Desulfobulbus sp.]